MDPLPSDTFARRLRTERERSRISQAGLARSVAEALGSNIDPSAITRIEQGTRAVRLDEAVAIADALGTPLMALLADEDEEDVGRAQMTPLLTELAAAQHRWDLTRQDIERLMLSIQALGGAERAGLLGHEPMDPDLREAIDDRMDEGGRE